MILALLSLAVLLVCGYMVGRELLSRQKEKEDFEQLAKLVTVKSPAASPTPTGPPAADEHPAATATPTPGSEEESQEQRRDALHAQPGSPPRALPGSADKPGSERTILRRGLQGGTGSPGRGTAPAR